MALRAKQQLPGAAPAGLLMSQVALRALNPCIPVPAKAGKNQSAGKLRFPLPCSGFACASDATPIGAYGPQTAYAVRLPCNLPSTKGFFRFVPLRRVRRPPKRRSSTRQGGRVPLSCLCLRTPVFWFSPDRADCRWLQSLYPLADKPNTLRSAFDRLILNADSDPSYGTPP